MKEHWQLRGRKGESGEKGNLSENNCAPGKEEYLPLTLDP